MLLAVVCLTAIFPLKINVKIPSFLDLRFFFVPDNSFLQMSGGHPMAGRRRRPQLRFGQVRKTGGQIGKFCSNSFKSEV